MGVLGNAQSLPCFTPGIFVDRVVEVPEPLQESQLVAEGRRYP